MKCLTQEYDTLADELTRNRDSKLPHDHESKSLTTRSRVPTINNWLPVFYTLSLIFSQELLFLTDQLYFQKLQGT